MAKPAAGIGVESPKCEGIRAAGLGTYSLVTRLAAAAQESIFSFSCLSHVLKIVYLSVDFGRL